MSELELCNMCKEFYHISQTECCTQENYITALQFIKVAIGQEMGEQKQDYEKINIAYLKEYQESQDNNILLQIYNNNRGLFFRIIKKLSGKIEESDALQECYFALLKAVKSYQEEKGSFANHLASVTYWHLCGCMQRDNLVKTPAYIRQLEKNYFSLLATLEEKNKTPSDHLIMLYLNISYETLNTLYMALATKNTASLNVPIDEEEGASLENFISSDYDLEAESLEEIHRQEVTERVQECISSLSEQDQEYIKGHFYEGLTLAELNPNISVSSNRQKLQRAIQHMKNNKAVNLRPLYDEIIYSRALRGNGAETFRRTWTSSTEAIILYMEGIDE